MPIGEGGRGSQKVHLFGKSKSVPSLKSKSLPFWEVQVCLSGKSKSVPF